MQENDTVNDNIPYRDFIPKTNRGKCWSRYLKCIEVINGLKPPSENAVLTRDYNILRAANELLDRARGYYEQAMAATSEDPFEDNKAWQLVQNTNFVEVKSAWGILLREMTEKYGDDPKYNFSWRWMLEGDIKRKRSIKKSNPKRFVASRYAKECGSIGEFCECMHEINKLELPDIAELKENYYQTAREAGCLIIRAVSSYQDVLAKNNRMHEKEINRVADKYNFEDLMKDVLQLHVHASTKIGVDLGVDPTQLHLLQDMLNQLEARRNASGQISRILRKIIPRRRRL